MIHFSFSSGAWCAVALLALGSVAPLVAGPADLTRAYDLEPGWNAIYVDVTLADSAPERVFGTVPVESVWCYFPSETPVKFLSDPKEGLANVPGWTAFFPAQSEHALQTNLYAVQPGRSYLIKLQSSTRQTLRLTGKPAYVSPRWVADGFTLTGLQTDWSAPVAVGDYFSSSPAHDRQPVYRLSPAGGWARLPLGATAKPGEAFWVFTKSATDFKGPLELDLRGRAGIDFGATTDRDSFQLLNRTSRTVTVQMSAEATTADALLMASGLAGDNTRNWVSLTNTSVTLPAGGRQVIQLGVNRTVVTADVLGKLTLRGSGFGFSIPLTIEANVAATAATLREGAPLAAAAPSSPNAGLWVGRVTIQKVSYHLAANPTEPRPAASEFSFNLLLHVDEAGAVTLLKEVWLMRKLSGTDYALVTDPARLNDYLGATTKDGERFAYRFSSIGFDFQDPATRRTLDKMPLTGSFAPGSAMTAEIFLGHDAATNPFRHQFHPDHDDKDREFRALPGSIYAGTTVAAVEQQEVYELTRQISLQLDAPPTAAVAGLPAWTGIYAETLRGLHRQPLFVAGTFTLKRANGLAELNPAP